MNMFGREEPNTSCTEHRRCFCVDSAKVGLDDSFQCLKIHVPVNLPAMLSDNHFKPTAETEPTLMIRQTFCDGYCMCTSTFYPWHLGIRFAVQCGISQIKKLPTYRRRSMVSLHILMPATEVAAAVGKWKMEVRELFCFYSHGGSGFPRLGALIWESF